MNVVSDLTEGDARQIIQRLAELTADRRWHAWTPYPWQKCPTDRVPTQGMFLLLGGRGTGKTDGAARYVIEHVRGPACDPRLPGGHRLAIVAPTMGDAVESCVNGPSGLKRHDPNVRLRSGIGGTHVLFPGGAEAKLFGAFTPEDIERLRAGGNRCLVFLEELAAMRYLGAVLEHTSFGLRLGANPHYVSSTTPKPRPELRRLLQDPNTVVTRGKTADAHHLDEAVRQKLFDAYAGTRLGRQELDGEILDDIEGALWTWAMIDAGRVDERPSELARTVVAFDPAVSVTESSDESGIVAAGRDQAGQYYVLADRSMKTAGSDAARRVWQLWSDIGADEVVWETNQGGEWVRQILADTWRAMVREGSLDAFGEPPLASVHAKHGKRTRAEPVAAAYELGKVHHVGAFSELEDQLTSWVADSGASSPDRLDALVYAIARLDSGGAPAQIAAPVAAFPARGTFMGRR